MVIVTFY
ncbi:Protein of unknown function [Bacillus mycoides]|nr:Protein of unknown function [Bacillus mycoides]SCC31774.1 Protein of unknown function [Bacillus mycoides]